jgi:hypothetical protein
MHYILVNKQPVACSLQEWAQWFSYNNGLGRIVAQEKVDGTNILVSTVFLGLDHRHSGDVPILFETMIFGGLFDQYQNRYATWDEAVVGHNEAVKKVSEHIKNMSKVQLDKIYAEAKTKYKKTLKKLSE